MPGSVNSGAFEPTSAAARAVLSASERRRRRERARQEHRSSTEFHVIDLVTVHGARAHATGVSALRFAGIRVIAIVAVAVFVIAACIAPSVRELVAR